MRKSCKLSKERVQLFLSTHEISPGKFCKWLGVSRRTLQIWMASERFPRMLEIIVTHEPPPRPHGSISQLGPIITDISEGREVVRKMRKMSLGERISDELRAAGEWSA